MTIEDVLEHLRMTMAEKRFRQTDLQRHLGWKGSYISQFLYGYKRMPVEDLLGMLRVMRVPAVEFFEGVEGRRQQPFEGGSQGDKSTLERLAGAWSVHRRTSMSLSEDAISGHTAKEAR